MSRERTIYKSQALAPALAIGQVLEVGGFFWIPEHQQIGFDEDARHGHDLRWGGSVAENCTLEVRGFLGDDHVVVRLDRPSLPYGAQAPIGAVFYLSTETVRSWPEMLRKKQEFEATRAKLASQFLR